MAKIDQLAAEAFEIRERYLEFWGAHSSKQIGEVGVEPTCPKTPILDEFYPRHGSTGTAKKRSNA